MNIAWESISLLLETAEYVHVVIDYTCRVTWNGKCWGPSIHPIKSSTHHLSRPVFRHSLLVSTIDVWLCQSKIEYCNTSHHSVRPTYKLSACMQPPSVHIWYFFKSRVLPEKEWTNRIEFYYLWNGTSGYSSNAPPLSRFGGIKNHRKLCVFSTCTSIVWLSLYSSLEQ